MKNTGIAIGLAVAVLAAPTLAGEPKLSATYETCMAAPQSTTASMQECMNAESKRWDVRLNRAYKTLVKQLDDPEYKADLKRLNNQEPKNREKLVAAQRLWLKYRKAKCGVLASLTGGTIDILAAAGCWLDTLAHRTLELEAMLEP